MMITMILPYYRPPLNYNYLTQYADILFDGHSFKTVWAGPICLTVFCIFLVMINATSFGPLCWSRHLESRRK